MNKSIFLPQAGEIWRHFKGQDYKIMGVSDSEEIPDHPVDYWAIHTETEEMLAIYHHDEKITVTTIGGTAIAEPLVIYYKNESAKVWARPLDNFLEVLGDEPTYFYRFEKIA